MIRALSASLLVTLACAPAPTEGEGEGEGEEGEGEEGEGEGEEGEGEEGEGEEGEGEGEACDFTFGDEETIDAIAGASCSLEERIGFVYVLDDGFGGLYLDAKIDDGVPVDLGPAVVSEPPCAHYHPADCAGCDEGTCGYAGDCVDIVRAEPCAVVGVDDEQFTVDTEIGRISGVLTPEADGHEYEVRVHVPGEPTIRFTSALPTPFADWLHVVDDGFNGSTGAVHASWESAGEGAQMRLHFRANHHVPIGFSECLVEDDLEALTASANLIDPLRIGTGFEGGTASRVFVGSAQLDAGCLEIAVMAQTLIVPDG